MLYKKQNKQKNTKEQERTQKNKKEHKRTKKNTKENTSTMRSIENYEQGLTSTLQPVIQTTLVTTQHDNTMK